MWHHHQIHLLGVRWPLKLCNYIVVYIVNVYVNGFEIKKIKIKKCSL